MENKPTSALSIALAAVGDRWTLAVIRELAFGPRRFTDLATVTRAPRDVLSARLRAMEAQAILEREPYGSGKRERYVLTDKGVDLAEVVLVLKKWGDRYKPAGTETVELEHTVCGETFEAEVHCAACHRELHRDELVERPS